jgi:tetratricopeptide (TPR) repeat protein
MLGYEVRSLLDPAGKRRLIVSVLREALLRRTTLAPLVLVIEDLHWRDASSADVLAEVTAAVAPLRCLFVSTSREPSDVTWLAETIAVDALPAAAATALIDRLSPVPLDAPTRALILERTAGNPFFIEEVVRSLRPGTELTVPATVQDLLEARLDALDEAPRRVAQGAAVIGRTFATRVLARVTPDEDLDPALGTLEREHFVGRVAIAEPTYSFAHALVQEVAYRTQLIAHRRQAHVVVGDAYSDLFGERIEEFIDTLAFHYRRGDNDPKARTWLMRAGHRAQRLYANTEALDYFTACIERSANDTPSRSEALEAIADVQRVMGKYEDALAAYAQALDVRATGDIVERARVRRKSAIVHQLRGDMTAALAIFEDVLELLPPDATAERSRALLNIAEVRWRQGHYDDAVATLERSIADAERAGDDDARAEALKQIGTVHSHRGELEKALGYFGESLAAYERLGDVLGAANVHNNVGLANRRRSRHAESVEAYRRALAIRERIGDQLGRVHSHNNIGQIEYLRGELAAAEADFTAGLQIARALGYTMGIGATGLGLGATKVERGDTAGGIAELQAAVDVLERAGSLANVVDGLRDLGMGYLAARSRKALAVAERAVDVARGLGLPESQGIALQVLGMARAAFGDVAGATAALEASRALLERLDDRQELARTLGALGRTYARLPEKDARRMDADRLLSEARAIFIELGAALDLRRLGAA